MCFLGYWIWFFMVVLGWGKVYYKGKCCYFIDVEEFWVEMEKDKWEKDWRVNYGFVFFNFFMRKVFCEFWIIMWNVNIIIYYML